MSETQEKSAALAVVREEQPAATLVPSSQTFEPTSISEAMQLARVLVNSRLLPKAISTPEAAFTIILAGKELGLTAMQSLRTIHVIEGKPTLSADLMIALVQRAPECKYFRPVKSDNTVAIYETLRAGHQEPTRLAFTIEDAQRAGLTGKDNWRKYPAAMLRARCGSALARAVYPERVLGVYDPDELEPLVEKKQGPTRGKVTDLGATIEVSANETLTEKLAESVSPAEQMIAECKRGFINWEQKRAWADANKDRKAGLPVEERERVRAAFNAAHPTRKAETPPAEEQPPEGETETIDPTAPAAKK